MCVFAMTAANAQITSVALVGAGAGGWPDTLPSPIDLHQFASTDGENWSISNLTLTTGGVKFRANNTWGGAGFEWAGPWDKGIGTSVGDIPAVGGIYDITLNTTTGAYAFTASAGVSVVKLAGSSLSSEVTMSTADSNTYTFTGFFNAGAVKFNIDGVMNGGSFPTGNATPAGSDIMVTSGEWTVSIDLGTGDYTFTAAPIKTVSIIGLANVDWNTDTPLTTTDGIHYSITDVTFIAGKFIFRQDNNWNVKFAGDVDGVEFFAPLTPGAGTLSTAGKDLVVTAEQAGTYDITFNRQTLGYTFTLKTLGLNKLDAKSFSVYPNPSQGAWNITSKNNNIKSVQVYDINGRVVRNTATTTVDGTTLAKGIYFAKVTTENASATVKLIKN